MHRLVVKLVLDEHPGSLTQADLDAATVVIKNAPIRGMATLEKGIETDYVTEGDILPLPLGDNTFCALIPWVDNNRPGSRNESIEVRAAGTVASYPIQWPAGHDIYPNGQTLIRLTLADNEGLGDYITTYAALKSACAAATGTADNPTRITLGADIEFPGTTSDCINISHNQYVEINGNGYRLTRAATAGALFLVSSNASLKLTRMTVDGENKETDEPLIDVSTAIGPSFAPGTLTLGEGFMLTGAALPAADASDNAYKLNRTPGINVSGTLIMEKGSQVTGNVRGYPVHLTGSTRAILRLNGGTFGNNADADLCLTGGRGMYDTPPTVTVGLPLPDAFACSLVLDNYLNADQSIRFPTVITGTGTGAIPLTPADVPRFTLKTVFYRDAAGDPYPSALPFSLYLDGADIGLQGE